uniref:1-alkyl-2-acetylglycerophosphocholine esterase n=1 Tax=Moniliophthora roreri TaxID=221103 RepID=A0A0W0EZD9_MONRR
MFLDEPKGLPVGSTTFTARIPTPITSGSVQFQDNERRGLSLEEVAFTAYYPAEADIQSKSFVKGLHWVTRPLRTALEGYVRFSGASTWIAWSILLPIVYLYGRFIPAYLNAPLLNPNKAPTPQKQWPLVIFSHGLGGSHTAQICTRLASSGRVVLAIEHRDGTATSCVTRSWDSEGKCSTRPILYIRESDATYGEDDKDALMPLRRDQLVIRHYEIYTAFDYFSRFVRKQADPRLKVEGDSGFKADSWTDNGDAELPVRLDDVCLAGHSFGGCTTYSILSSNPPEGFLRIPITHALIYDPWLEPLPLPGPVPLSSSGIKADPAPLFSKSSSSGPEFSLPKMLVINSESFTLWKDHFTRLEGVVQKWGSESKLLTLVRSKHPDFSDFPVLPLIQRKGPVKIMEIIEQLSLSFLNDKLNQKLELEKTRKMEVEIVGRRKDGRPKRRIVGELGDIVVH